MAFVTARPSLERFATFNHTAPPPSLGRRYDRQGTFLPEEGNTVVCHLTAGMPSEMSVLAARERLIAVSSPGKLAFTPPASLHMTLFEGVIETRRSSFFWPEDQPFDTPIADMTELLLRRLDGFEGCGPFQVRVVDATPNGLQLAGETPEDERVLRAWRDALTVPFGFRQPHHDSYGFHMTFAYVIEWLTDEELGRWQAELDEMLSDLKRDAPVLSLNPPAFCRFADMTYFEELLVLG